MFYVNPKQFVENRICFFGVWEPQITDLISSLLKPGDIVIDIGANIGYFTLLASGLVGSKGKVYAVEASESTRQRLNRNLEINRCTNSVVVPYAAWSESGETNFFTNDADRGGSSLRELGGSKPMERVALRRIDSIIPRQDYEHVRLIKVDIEGAECQALEGLSSLLSANSNVLVVCEVEDRKLAGLGRSAADLFALLASFGFRPFEIPNNYDVLEYLRRPKAVELLPLSEAPTRDAYVLFSRQDLGDWCSTSLRVRGS